MKKPSVKAKKAARIVYTVIDLLLCAAVVFGMAYAGYLYLGYKQSAGLPSQYEPMSQNSYKRCLTDAQGDSYFAGEGSFSVLVISDLKLIGGRFSLETDKNTLDALYELVKAEAPDVVIINGGVPQTSFSESGWIDNLSGFQLLLSFMKQINVCWAVSECAYESDFYNSCTRNTPASLCEHCYDNPLLNRYQSKTFSGTQNTSIIMCGLKGAMRMGIAVLDFSSGAPENISCSANERWLGEWLSYLDTNTDRNPKLDQAEDCVKYVISPYSLNVPDTVTLLLPEKAEDGEFFSYTELKINPVQTEQQ